MSPKSEIQSPKSKDGVIRYLAIYAALWKTSVTREMSFKIGRAHV